MPTDAMGGRLSVIVEKAIEVAIENEAETEGGSKSDVIRWILQEAYEGADRRKHYQRALKTIRVA